MEPLRPAGYNERRCIARDVLGLYGNVVTLATYTGPKVPSNTEIHKALKHCIAQNPVLSTVIQDSETERPTLARATSIHLENHVLNLDLSGESVATEARDNYVLDRIHNEAPSDYGIIPQWRFWIIPSTTPAPPHVEFQVAFACSHALADGMSGFVFHRSFVRALANDDDPTLDNNAVHDVVSHESLLPSLDRIAVLPISWSFLLRPLLSEVLPAFLAQAVGLKDQVEMDAWIGSHTRPDLPSSTRLLSTNVEALLVPQAKLQRVMKSCRENGARLTGLLNYLTARSLAHCLLRRHQTYCKFKVETAIDLRKCIPEGHGRMANYISAIEEVLNVASISNPTEKLEPEDWATIRGTTATLSQAANTLSDQPIALLKYLPDFRKWTLKRASEAAKASFGMSNLGVFVDEATAGSVWKIVDMVFSQSADATGTPLNVNMASVKGGPLAITLTWWPGMLGVQDERDFVRAVLETIDTQLQTTCTS